MVKTRENPPLYTLQYALTEADFNHVYRVYLKTQRREEKATAMILISIVVMITLVCSCVWGFHRDYLVYASLIIIVCISHIIVPSNDKFVRNHHTLYGDRHTLKIYPNFVQMEEQEDFDGAYDPESGMNRFEMKNIQVFETEQMFLLYKGCIHDYFEPIPKAMLSDTECAELRSYFVSLGKKYKKIQIQRKDQSL